MMEKELIASCGINCGICRVYLREKNTCPGCRLFNKSKPVTIARCKIRNCDELNKNNIMFCFECEEYPCDRIKHMDKRYRTKYHMSTIENLDFIKKNGTTVFLEKEKQKWGCPECGGIVTCHGGKCMSCGFQKFKN